MGIFLLRIKSREERSKCLSMSIVFSSKRNDQQRFRLVGGIQDHAHYVRDAAIEKKLIREVSAMNQQGDHPCGVSPKIAQQIL